MALKPNSYLRGVKRSYLLDQHKIYLDTNTWAGKREYVLRRDNYTCQKCHHYGGELHVHHKTYKRHGNESVNDLITLCKSCHEKIHT
jgi:5-methylcytosine-specific restriction endonuclease McrA